ESSADFFAARSDRGSPPRPFGHPTSTGGWRLQRTGRPLGSARPSLRVDPQAIEHHLLHPSSDDSEARAVGASPSNERPPPQGSPAVPSVAPPSPVRS